VSALTLIVVPAAAFRDNWTSLQFLIGALLARLAVTVVLIPVLFRQAVRTPYEYLGIRFGPLTRSITALFFLTGRLMSSSVRLITASVAAGALLGWDIWPTLILITIFGVVSLAQGGVRASIWTGVWQASVVMLAGGLSLVFIMSRIEGGVVAVWSLAMDAEKFHFLEWGPRLGATGFIDRGFVEPTMFWAAIIVGFFSSAAAFGADHEMTQKVLANQNLREGQRAMVLSAVGSLAFFLVYLMFGTLMFVFYKQNPGMALPNRPDRVPLHFVVTVMPRLLRGLVLSAIVMASIDAPLSSLSEVFMQDIWRPLLRRFGKPWGQLHQARVAAYAFAALSLIVAVFLGRDPEELRWAFKIAGVASGPMLGVFILALSEKKISDHQVAVSFILTTIVNVLLLIYVKIGASWLPVIGAVGAWRLAAFLGSRNKTVSAAE
jgi:Na+/proline symporter